MPKTPDELLAFLASLGIETSTVRHPPLFTVEESQRLRGDIGGAHTKNLFLKDKKDNYFLLTLDEALLEMLGVPPGGVTAFGLINDVAKRVTFFLDSRLAEAAVVNAHPLTNEATTSIATDDLKRFVEATGHSLTVLNFGS